MHYSGRHVVVVGGAGPEERHRVPEQTQQLARVCLDLVVDLAYVGGARDAVCRPPRTDSGRWRVPWLAMSGIDRAAPVVGVMG